MKVFRIKPGEKPLVVLERDNGTSRWFQITTSERKFSAQMGAADPREVEDGPAGVVRVARKRVPRPVRCAFKPVEH
jgi:hypothetical protein